MKLLLFHVSRDPVVPVLINPDDVVRVEGSGTGSSLSLMSRSGVVMQVNESVGEVVLALTGDQSLSQKAQEEADAVEAQREPTVRNKRADVNGPSW